MPFLSCSHLLFRAFQNTENDGGSNQNTSDSLLDISGYQEYESAKNHRLQRREQGFLREAP